MLAHTKNRGDRERGIRGFYLGTGMLTRSGDILTYPGVSLGGVILKLRITFVELS